MPVNRTSGRRAAAWNRNKAPVAGAYVDEGRPVDEAELRRSRAEDLDGVPSGALGDVARDGLVGLLLRE